MTARRRSRSRRGLTLVELIVYLGLLTTGVTVLMGIEMGAQRALALQQALIDVELEASGLLGALRRDVEAARRLEVGREALVVVRHDGRRVSYEKGARVEAWEGGERRQGFASNAELRVSLDGAPEERPVVVVEATFERRGAYGQVRRTYRRTASPRGELNQ